MTRYLLDTNALIDYSKGREPAFSRINVMIASREELGVCAINITEFYAGLRPDERFDGEDFLTSLRYWDISREAAIRAGEDRYYFARRRQMLSTTDTMIAAVAREYNAIIVTDNVKDYPQGDIQILPLSP